MTTGIAQDKLRQIAILISSVDAATGRQLLLHLPTEAAKQVRAMVSRLGKVSAEEQRKILAEFQRSASNAQASVQSSAKQTSAKPSPTKLNSANLGTRQDGITDEENSFVESGGASRSRALGQRTFSEELPGSEPSSMFQAKPGASEDWQTAEREDAAAWTRLSASALYEFVRHERPAVVAVVLSQLTPRRSVDVLQRLPQDVSEDVLQRLARLQDISPEAMSLIDEHLAQRLGEFQHYVESELENSRRIAALLAAAPEELKSRWGRVLGTASATDQQLAPSAAPESVEAVAKDRGQLGHQHSSQQDPKGVVESGLAEVAGSHSHSQQASESDELDSANWDDPSSHILAFSGSDERRAEVDRSLLQVEFESILELPTHVLAVLLSSCDSQTVLLALAGASPQFTKQFYAKLNRRDARLLERKLQQIGAISLRDIDEAQRRIADAASGLSRIETNLGSRPILSAA